ncbi:COX15/CtaA family protein [Alicyclobacillus sp.]|uniref:COX15/CtaA family protein n=1 Tax=Alicyclobacillus sp. TaxID=61169 RepID=UPI0025BC0A36|nr:COX15/CtaA family protein [Alicyclobacillus sp.]MCL6517000.1 COX15/CtaA family protein [Alicyclobacillus sp.]
MADRQIVQSGRKRRPARRDGLWKLSAMTLVGLFIVNLAGFLDTETGSALGCGREWPLCNGAVIPSDWGLQTLIEFGHRAVVLVVSVLLVTTAVLAWRRYGRWVEVKWAVGIACGFVALEAFLGAIGVLFGDPPAVLATHLGVSLMAFAGMTLLTAVLGQIQSLPPSDANEGMALRPADTPKRFRRWVVVTLVYTLMALYIGAYIANIHAGAWFRGFPLPTESFAEAGRNLWFDILHRSIGLGLAVLCVWLWLQARRMPADRTDLRHGTTLAVALVAAQALSGGLLVYTGLAIPAFLLHVSIVSCLFATLAYLTLQSLPDPRRRFGSETDGTPNATVQHRVG